MKTYLLQLLMVFSLFSCNSQEKSSFCIGPIHNQGGIKENPDRFDGRFEFNYVISSKLKSNIDGTEETYDLDYFVNTTDGSILLSRTTMMVNFGEVDSEFGSVDGVIFLPSGNVVIYVYDKENDQKRALTIASDQTREDKEFNSLVFLREFLENARGLRSISSTPPTDIRGRTRAYTGTFTQDNGEKANMVIHFGENTNGRTIKTGVPLVGLGVGVLKDDEIGSCNRLVVYSKIQSDEGIFETTLLDMTPNDQSFNGSGYKKATLGFDLGALNYGGAEISDELDQALENDYERMNQILKQLTECSGDIDCQERLGLQLTEIQNRMHKRLADNAQDNSALGSDGTDFARKKRTIESRLFEIQEELIKKRADLKRNKRAMDNCNGNCRALDRERERISEEIEELEQEGKVLSCRMARLMGLEDALEDCQ